MAKTKDDRKSRPKRKKFRTIAYSKFNFDAVMREILDEDLVRINHLHEVYFSALSVWVVAPHDHELRRDAVRMRMRLILAKHEKEVLRAKRDQRSEVDAKLRSGKLKNFLNKVYYPLGGIKNLNSNSHSKRTSKYIADNYHNDIDNFLKLCQLIHYAKEANLGGDYHEISLRRTYEMLRKFNEHLRDTCSNGGKSGRNGQGNVYLSEKALEDKLKGYRGNVVLWYAASLVECSEGSLLDAFVGASTKGIYKIEDMQEKLNEWLVIASYLFKEVFGSVGSEQLNKVSDCKIIESVHQNAQLQEPKFSDWEVKIVKKVLKKSYRMPR